MSTAPPKVRPSGFLYLVPLLLLLGGSIAAVVAIVSGVQAYSDTIEGFARVPVGATGTVEIDGTGGYTVFYEPGVSDEDSLDTSDPEPPLEMTGPDGQPVTFSDYSSLGTYASSGYVGIAIQTFRVSQPGDYELEVGGQGLVGTVAVGRSPFNKITGGVLRGLLFGFLGFVSALVILIVLMVSRGRSKRRNRPAFTYPQQAGSGGPPAGYPPAQYPPGSYPPAAPPAAPPGGYGQPPGGFGPPPASPPAAPPPAPPGDDTTPGWGQPGR